MINKAILLGRLGADPEVRFLPSGGQVTTIRLATSRRWRDKQTNERKEETEWHRVVFFGRVAEIAGEYLKKGSQCYVEGRIRTQKWQDQSGQDRYTTEIVGEELHLLDSRRDGDTGAAPENRNSAPRSSSQPAPAAPNYDDFDDDIPFFDPLKMLIKHHLI